MIASMLGAANRLPNSFVSGIRKTALIYPAAFLMAVTMGQMTLGMVLYARTVLAVGGTRIGMLAGVWSLTYVFGCLVVRPWFNRVLPRYLIIGSTAVMAGLVFAMTLTATYWRVMPLYAAFGLVLSLYWPPLMGWVSTGLEDRELGRVLGRYNMSWCSGAVISPFLCGWLSALDARYPLFFAFYLLLFICVSVIGASRWLPGIGSDRATGAPHDTLPGAKDSSCPLRFPAWVGLYASFFGVGTLTAVFPLVALEAWAASETVVGMAFTGRGLANVAGFFLLGRIHGWQYKRLPMVAVQWLAVAAFAALSLAGSVTIAAGWLAVFGLSGAMSYASSFFHGAAGSLNRARRMAIHESILAAGLISGAVAGGWMYEQAASQRVFAGVSLLMAILTCLQIVVARTVDRNAQG